MPFKSGSGLPVNCVCSRSFLTPTRILSFAVTQNLQKLRQKSRQIPIEVMLAQTIKERQSSLLHNQQHCCYLTGSVPEWHLRKTALLCSSLVLPSWLKATYASKLVKEHASDIMKQRINPKQCSICDCFNKAANVPSVQRREHSERKKSNTRCYKNKPLVAT